MQVKGCFFHFTQCVKRKYMEFSSIARRSDECTLDVKSLCALAFVPVSDVPNAFLQLKSLAQKVPGIDSLFDYFENTFIGGLRANTRVGARKPALFPAKIWNVYERVLDNLPRTNNSVEGWHHVFDKSVNCHHPDVYHFINLLRKEEDNVRSDVVRASPK